MRLNQRDLCGAGGTHIIPAAESNTSSGPSRIKSNACSYPPQHFLILISFFPVTPNHLEHQSLTPSPIFHLPPFFLVFSLKRLARAADLGWSWQVLAHRMDRRDFKRPLSPSRLLSKLLLLFPPRCNVSTFPPFAFISLSPFYLRACLPARLESVNLMKSKV